MLKVVTAHRPPLAFVSETAHNGSQPLFSGFLIDLLPTLLQQANVVTTYDIYSLKVGAERTYHVSRGCSWAAVVFVACSNLCCPVWQAAADSTRVGSVRAQLLCSRTA